MRKKDQCINLWSKKNLKLVGKNRNIKICFLEEIKLQDFQHLNKSIPDKSEIQKIYLY